MRGAGTLKASLSDASGSSLPAAKALPRVSIRVLFFRLTSFIVRIL